MHIKVSDMQLAIVHSAVQHTKVGTISKAPELADCKKLLFLELTEDPPTNRTIAKCSWDKGPRLKQLNIFALHEKNNLPITDPILS